MKRTLSWSLPHVISSLKRQTASCFTKLYSNMERSHLVKHCHANSECDHFWHSHLASCYSTLILASALVDHIEFTSPVTSTCRNMSVEKQDGPGSPLSPSDILTMTMNKIQVGEGQVKHRDALGRKTQICFGNVHDLVLPNKLF